MNQNTAIVHLQQMYPHPKNAEMYGEPVMNPIFLESIERTGLIQPIVVTPIKNNDWYGMKYTGGDHAYIAEYRIVSGHRRYQAVRQLEAEGKLAWLRDGCISVEVREYDSKEAEEFDWLTSNAHRQKESKTMIREVLNLLGDNTIQKLCQPPYDGADEAERDEIEQSESQFTQEELAGRLGTSAKFIRAVQLVFINEHRDKYFTKLDTLGVRLTKKGKANVIANWDKIREAVYNGDLSLTAAFESLRGEFDAVKEKPKRIVAGKPKESKNADVAVSQDSLNTIDNAVNWLEDKYGEGFASKSGVLMPQLTLARMLTEYAGYVVGATA